MGGARAEPTVRLRCFAYAPFNTVRGRGTLPGITEGPRHTLVRTEALGDTSAYLRVKVSLSIETSSIGLLG